MSVVELSRPCSGKVTSYLYPLMGVRKESGRRAVIS